MFEAFLLQISAQSLAVIAVPSSGMPGTCRDTSCSKATILLPFSSVTTDSLTFDALFSVSY